MYRLKYDTRRVRPLTIRGKHNGVARVGPYVKEVLKIVRRSRSPKARRRSHQSPAANAADIEDASSWLFDDAGSGQCERVPADTGLVGVKLAGEKQRLQPHT